MIIFILADAKLEALRQFAIVINETRGWPQESDVQAFFDAGYAQQHVLEVIMGIAPKVLSNYTNHIAETDLEMHSNLFNGRQLT